MSFNLKQLKQELGKTIESRGAKEIIKGSGRTGVEATGPARAPAVDGIWQPPLVKIVK